MEIGAVALSVVALAPNKEREWSFNSPGMEVMNVKETPLRPEDVLSQNVPVSDECKEILVTYLVLTSNVDDIS